MKWKGWLSVLSVALVESSLYMVMVLKFGKLMELIPINFHLLLFRLRFRLRLERQLWSILMCIYLINLKYLSIYNNLDLLNLWCSLPSFWGHNVFSRRSSRGNENNLFLRMGIELAIDAFTLRRYSAWVIDSILRL